MSSGNSVDIAVLYTIQETGERMSIWKAFKVARLLMKYRDLAEFIILLVTTISAKIQSKSGTLSPGEKSLMKKEFGEAIDKSF